MVTEFTIAFCCARVRRVESRAVAGDPYGAKNVRDRAIDECLQIHLRTNYAGHITERVLKLHSLAGGK